MKINFKTVKQFIALAILLKSAVACSSEELSFNEGATPFTKGDTPPPSEIYTDSTKNGAIVLGERVGNPYNIDTLKKAYAFLHKMGKVRSVTPKFTPTHYQLRFLPADSIEFSKLMRSGLVFTTIPLDKNISEEGTYYFDPQLEEQGAKYTWQYTLVPVTDQLPDVRHEIVAEICAPNDGTRSRSADLLSDVWPALELKAHEMCGQIPPSETQSRGAGDAGLPGEAGKFIYVWDDKANQYIPAKGAYVVAFGNSWSASATTNEKGSYASLKTGGPITRMAIQWQEASSKWIVYDGASENDVSKQAIYACSSLEPKFTYRIKGGKQQTFAVVTRAFHRFYHEYNQSLPVPPGGVMALCIDASSPQGYAGVYSPGNKILLWGRDKSGNQFFTEDVFGHTAHELGHLLHYRNIISNTKNWNKTEKIVMESWARCIQSLIQEYEYNELGRILGRSEPLTFVTKQSLPNIGISGPPGQPGFRVYNVPNGYNFQDWPTMTTPDFVVTDYWKKHVEYAPIIIDLIDTDNQSDYYRAFGIQNSWPKEAYKLYPNDLVSGYTIEQIISALKPSVNLEQLRENIKNVRYNSAADKVKVDTLFNKYIYYWNKYR